ncbi:MAG TPA: glycoside hydrolase family 32 protein [Prolixibacteraceae bacterium]|nr:glycoside hydrolase family 32 protein [Prolixibacteraceae bacterium]
MKFSFLILVFFMTSFGVLGNKPVKTYDELLRPQYHFTPEKNWMNDPNGLVYYKGEYHLFYQHNPFGNEWGFMHWGHAISTDLVHWQQMPIALTPDNDSKDKDQCTAYSGSGLVDENNVTGLQKGEEKTILLFYTSKNCGQRLAYSNDKGRTWIKYDKNPIIAFDPNDDARDPKVIWHEPSQQYVMALYRRPDNDDKQKGVSFYTSKNLLNWQLKSHIIGFFECPDLVQLPVDRKQDDKRWVLFDGDGSYVIGQFNGEKFTPETAKMWSDYGKNYYATQTWSNIPSSDGRTIQIAWMKGGQYPDMPFNGQMTFPCELSLKKYIEGVKLIRKPIKEIELLHGKGQVWEDKNLIPGIAKNLLHGIKGDCFHIIGDFNIKSADNFGFIVRLDKDKNGAEILYNVKTHILTCLGQSTALEPVDGKIKLEVLLDRSSLELFANDGKVVMSSNYVADAKADALYLFNNGGELQVNKLEVYPVKSIWEKKD